MLALAAAIFVLLSNGIGAGPVPQPDEAVAAPAGTELARAGKQSRASRKLVVRSTHKQAELRETIPIKRRAKASRRVVLSLPLPRLHKGDRIRGAGEIATSTTCVEQAARCIGRMYHFDPHLRARIMLAPSKRAAGSRRTRAVSRTTRVSCGQRRPNRNHHCPLSIGNAGLRVPNLKKLPCAPKSCRLNFVLSAHNRRARGGERLVLGGDRPNGSVKQGKARLSATIMRGARKRLKVHNYTSSKRRYTRLAPDFSGGHRATYSHKLRNLKRGDVLIVRARQLSALPGADPYFVSNRLILSSRRRATRPSKIAKRSISSRGKVTPTNGFNCTGGPSGFRSPCLANKAGIVRVRRTPKRPLYVNLVTRTFPLVAQQARANFPPVKILSGGGVAVQRLRQKPRRSGGGDRPPGGSGGGGSGPGGGGGGSGGGGSGGGGGGGGGVLPPLPPLPPLPGLPLGHGAP